MISVVLNGGLGNQLFQIFAGASLALAHNKKLVCKHIDKNRETANGKVFFVDTEPLNSRLTDVRERNEFEFESLAFDNVRLRGYFQHADYFHANFDRCADLLRLKRYHRQHCGTAFHVRRTDYKKLSHIYVELSPKYYVDACKGFPRPYTIVTDEIDEYVKDLAQVLQSEVRSTSLYDDFQFLCEHDFIVCANSTFSWWAGYLVRSRGGTAVIPDSFMKTGKGIRFPE